MRVQGGKSGAREGSIAWVRAARTTNVLGGIMDGVAIGQQPPSFRLPSGQGGEIELEDYRGRSNVIVWFTPGMACPFCRSHMSQLARGYPRFKGLNAEVLQVTPTKPERAQVYARRFSLPFPYLCDPDYRVYRAWGFDVRSHSFAWYAKRVYGYYSTELEKPASDFDVKPSPGEVVTLVQWHDMDMGFFILDREGVLRYAVVGPYVTEQGVRRIPSNDEVARELEACGRGQRVG